MKKTTVTLLLILFSVTVFGAGEAMFDKYFIDETMRVDYFHTGDARTEIIAIDQVYKQGIWAGSMKNLIDNFNLGRYYVKVFDKASGELIYSKGFDSYFGEYKTTGPALNGVKRTYHETAMIPYPKKPIIFKMFHRDKYQKLYEIFAHEINPESVSILRESLKDGVKVFELHKSGDPHTKVDIVIVAEGYTQNESKKVPADFDKFTKIFFKWEPFKSMMDKFNIWGVYFPSEETGIDEPRSNIYRRTAVGATFNSLGSARYILTEDNKSLRDIIAHVPYDTVLIMINHKRYGGGGIYNFYATFTSDNQWKEYVMVHEFGHLFGGLADEYYSSSTAYNEFYPPGTEPLEPNITALLDPANVKWKDLLSEGIEVPTPWEKEDFDKADSEYQKKRAEYQDKISKLYREKASWDAIRQAEEESEALSKNNQEQQDKYLENSKYWGKVGVFEGAGYSSKGLYRPMIDCLMFSKGLKPFCSVCEAQIKKVIAHYTE